MGSEEAKRLAEMMATVDHPGHYNAGRIEVIEAIEDWDLDFNLGNVVKYVGRARHKGAPAEDLLKARWYLDRAIRRLVETQPEGAPPADEEEPEGVVQPPPRKLRAGGTKALPAAVQDGDKRCRKCGQIKPLAEFARLSASPDGHQPYCRACTSAMTKKRRQRQRAASTPPDRDGRRTCTRCGEEKPLEEYGNASHGAKKRTCRVCISEIQRAAQTKAKPKVAEAARAGRVGSPGRCPRREAAEAARAGRVDLIRERAEAKLRGDLAEGEA